MKSPVDPRVVLALTAPPLIAGVVLGANHARAGAALSWPMSIVYWIAIAFATWLALAVATLAVRGVLRPWSLPGWIVWLVGAIAGSFVARPVIYGITNAFLSMMATPAMRRMPPAALSTDFLAYYLSNWTLVIVLWMAMCWSVTRRVPGAAPAIDRTIEGAPLPRPATGFLRRLPPEIGIDVIALAAEDHYVQVFTPLGKALVHATMADAIQTLEDAGFRGERVHRSWWVAEGAVERSSERDRRYLVHLINGVEVPVSQTYRETARRAGVLK